MEAEAFITGSGVAQPYGLKTALDGGASEVATATADTLVAADIYTLRIPQGDKMTIGNVFAGAGGGTVVGGAIVRLALDAKTFEQGLKTSEGKLLTMGTRLNDVSSNFGDFARRSGRPAADQARSCKTWSTTGLCWGAGGPEDCVTRRRWWTRLRRERGV